METTFTFKRREISDATTALINAGILKTTNATKTFDGYRAHVLWTNKNLTIELIENVKSLYTYRGGRKRPRATLLRFGKEYTMEQIVEKLQVKADKIRKDETEVLAQRKATAEGMDEAKGIWVKCLKNIPLAESRTVGFSGPKIKISFWREGSGTKYSPFGYVTLDTKGTVGINMDSKSMYGSPEKMELYFSELKANHAILKRTADILLRELTK